MHICHIIEAAGGGSGQVVLDLIRANIAGGDQVTLIYAPARAEHRFVAAVEDMKGSLRVFLTPMQRKVSAHDAMDFWHLLLLLKKTGPFDVLHSHSSKAGALTRVAGLFLKRTPQVYSPHAFITMAPGTSKIYGAIEWVLSWLGADIICVSEQERKHAQDYLKIPATKLHVVPNGVSSGYPALRSDARRILGFSPEDFIVGFAGRLVSQKNPARLASAFALIAAQHPHAMLAIIGEGPLRFETLNMLTSHGLAKRVRFFTDHAARDLMPGFDCLLVSSDYESFGLVIIEAMDAGLPVVSTPVGIAEDAIIPGETGFIATDFSAESLAFHTLNLMKLNTEMREKITMHAKTQASHFSTERMAKLTRDLYAALLARRKKQAT